MKDLDKSNATAASWANHKWYMEWQKNTSHLHIFIPSLGPSPLGMTLLHGPSWVILNCLCTGIGLFRSTMHKWGLVPSANCRCGTEKQTADHILASWPLYHPPNGTLSLGSLDDDTVDWLQTTELWIWLQDRPQRRRKSSKELVFKTQKPLKSRDEKAPSDPGGIHRKNLAKLRYINFKLYID